MNQLLAVVCLFVGSYIDSRAVIYASEIWSDDRFHLRHAVVSGAAFTIGFFAYVAALRFLSAFGITSATLQILFAVVVTTALTLLMSGDIRSMSVGQLVACAVVLAGVAYLGVTVG